jgi:Zinc finger, C3HC4 type (RING finger)
MSILTHASAVRMYGADGPYVMEMYGFEQTLKPYREITPMCSHTHGSDSDSTIDIMRRIHDPIPDDVAVASIASANEDEKNRLRKELEAQQKYIADLEIALSESMKVGAGKVGTLSTLSTLSTLGTLNTDTITNDNRTECMICFRAGAVNTVLVPCGHTCCSTCAAGITTCPQCRAVITARQQFFM